MKTIIGETAVPDGVHFPPSWPHRVLQAAVAMRTAYSRAGRAGSPSPGDLEALGDALLDAATAELEEVIVPSRRDSSGEAVTTRGGRMVNPFDLPEETRGEMDELLPPIIFGRADGS
jgi:hypothetical protein